MGAIPGFEQDVFISYAHIDNHAQFDNRPLSEEAKGWVDLFCYRLRIRLTQLVGEEVSVWYDHQLASPDFRPEIHSKISNTAVFVSIVSPRYVRSAWCLEELDEIRNSALKRHLPIGNKSRVIKVVKTDVPLKDHPETLQGLVGYEFYERDERGMAAELRPDFGPPRDLRYWDKLEQLAWYIKQVIETIKALPPPSDRKAIYLAETTFDLREERERIKNELQQHAHVIFPDRDLPLVADQLREAVRGYLSGSDFSVHLIGDRYGIIPEGESKSIIHLQSDLAAERKNGFERIVWMPLELQARDEPQQRLIDSLRHGQNGHGHVELLQTKLEDLKKFIREKIAAEPERVVDPNFVYLICDRQDLDATQSLQDCLDDLGIKVVPAAAEGTKRQVLEYHKTNLLECGAVLVYYGEANEIWMRMKQRELQKLVGYGRTEPLLATGIFIGAPRTDAKERMRDRDAVIMKNYGKFSPDSLKPYLERMREAFLGRVRKAKEAHR